MNRSWQQIVNWQTNDRSCLTLNQVVIDVWNKQTFMSSIVDLGDLGRRCLDCKPTEWVKSSARENLTTVQITTAKSKLQSDRHLIVVVVRSVCTDWSTRQKCCLIYIEIGRTRILTTIVDLQHDTCKFNKTPTTMKLRKITRSTKIMKNIESTMKIFQFRIFFSSLLIYCIFFILYIT